MALGAKASDVLTMVIGEGIEVVLLGVGLGFLGAVLLTDFLKTLLYEVTPTDPLTFGTAALLLTVGALAACYIPARRATSVGPLTALRHE